MDFQGLAEPTPVHQVTQAFAVKAGSPDIPEGLDIQGTLDFPEAGIPGLVDDPDTQVSQVFAVDRGTRDSRGIQAFPGAAGTRAFLVVVRVDFLVIQG